ncbi:TIR domain-containing protein [Planctomicrobium sp. SH668]|uniref:TIR domain-containing protein n=1 Tax=Planctomicrobium sp. SH668 TaxID=3448126 RepID=UPI003F5C00AC
MTTRKTPKSCGKRSASTQEGSPDALLQAIENAAREIARRCEASDLSEAFDALTTSIETAGKAHSGSWLGYQSRVYYRELEIPPPGSHFDPTWGLMNRYSNGTDEGWFEYPFDAVYEFVVSSAKNPNLDQIKKLAIAAAEEVRELKERLSSLLITLNEREDRYLSDLLKDCESLRMASARTLIGRLKPSGKFFSHDMVALSNGIKPPPHIAAYGEVAAYQEPYSVAGILSKIAGRARTHLSHRNQTSSQKPVLGDKIFIGHGRSAAWRDLKDFLQDRLHLPWDEFNRVSAAGITVVARLSRMLDEAAFAFLVMTAEDETKDGKIQARMNVIHEAGLFQGRLGFERAIILLEEGCEEFSNVEGLVQIRFPAGNISAIYEDIRRVLEREDLLNN